VLADLACRPHWDVGFLFHHYPHLVWNIILLFNASYGNQVYADIIEDTPSPWLPQLAKSLIMRICKWYENEESNISSLLAINNELAILLSTILTYLRDHDGIHWNFVLTRCRFWIEVYLCWFFETNVF
jgi:hypothetical protein